MVVTPQQTQSRCPEVGDNNSQQLLAQCSYSKLIPKCQKLLEFMFMLPHMHDLKYIFRDLNRYKDAGDNSLFHCFGVILNNKVCC